MAIHYGGRYTSVDQITGPSGFYNIKLGNDNVVVYVDQEYDGGGWVCVIANNMSSGGMRNLSYYDAVNSCNYRLGSDTSNTNQPLYNLSGLDYRIWIGTKYWELLGKRNNSSYVTVTQFVTDTRATPLSGVHTKRYRWKFDNFTTSFAFSGVSGLSDETNTGTPGLFNYHATNGYSLSTYDNDQDTYGTSCSVNYGGNPWWYGDCWSGNYFGYDNGPYWTGSGGDNHQYGAIYIK
jgi:hypothetical protein